MHVKGSIASKALGVGQHTLRKLADDGRIKCVILPSGHRRYDVDSFVASSIGEKEKIVYARVSSAAQKDDLERQAAMLEEAYPGYEVVKDVGSGINFKRKGLLSVLERTMRRDVEVVVVAHRDRLARFAFDLLHWIFRSNGVELVVHEPSVDTPEKELVDDLLSIVTVFASRSYGRRKYKKRTGRKKEEKGAEESTGKSQQEDQSVPERSGQETSDGALWAR
jgi:predicted site-specific integrase-resolvase